MTEGMTPHDGSLGSESHEQDNQIPFSIRGSHLFTYSLLTRGIPRENGEIVAISADMFAFTQAMIAEGRRENLVTEDEQLIWEDKHGAEDAFSVATATSSRKRFFRGFLSLPDDYPAEIVVGRRDALCGLAAIGNQCDNREGFGPDAYFRQLRDQRGVSLFMEEAENQGYVLGRDFRLEPQLTAFVDASPEEVFCVQTTIGITKAVLKNSAVLSQPIKY